MIGFALFASATPSPLYETYSRLWDFSPLVLTLVYATYAVGVLAALLLAGRASDDAGRRPVLLLAISALLIASVVYMLAESVAWLFVARGVQGLATGLVLTASAGLLDFHPRRDPESVGLTNGVVSAAGIGLGALVSSALVQLLPAPRVLPYMLVFILFAITFVGVLLMPEPVADRSRLRLQRPQISDSVRQPFLVAALAVTSAYSIGGLFLALGPQLSGQIFETGNHLVTGIGIFLLAGFGSLAQLAYGAACSLDGRRRSARPRCGCRGPADRPRRRRGCGGASSDRLGHWVGPGSASLSSGPCGRCRRRSRRTIVPGSCPRSSSSPTQRSRFPLSSPAWRSGRSGSSRPSRSSAGAVVVLALSSRVRPRAHHPAPCRTRPPRRSSAQEPESRPRATTAGARCR